MLYWRSGMMSLLCYNAYCASDRLYRATHADRAISSQRLSDRDVKTFIPTDL